MKSDLVGLGNEGEASDSEEVVGGSGNGTGGPSGVAEGGAGADAESDAEDLMVESESDSDQSNQDAASAQRSVQTGATAGSDTGMIQLCRIIFVFL